ncbi:hypothetical protein BC828DRAFT_374048 [Blastocladiella britannica]|nr:hypothetical protein BC828DRAFT_374048 [Blastocladiella britannica]
MLSVPSTPANYHAAPPPKKRQRRTNSNENDHNNTVPAPSIATPKLARFLRPLRSKLANFRAAAATVPHAARALAHSPPSISLARGSSPLSFPSPSFPSPALTTTTTRADRLAKRQRSTASPGELDWFLNALDRHDPPSSSSLAPSAPVLVIPSPLKPAAGSVADAYRDVLSRTLGCVTRGSALPTTVASLAQMAAYAVGDLIASEYDRKHFSINENDAGASDTDSDDPDENCVAQVEFLYSTIPAHLRGRVLLQHATRICIYTHAKEPMVLLPLLKSAVDARAVHQARELALAIAAAETRATVTAVQLAQKASVSEPILQALASGQSATAATKPWLAALLISLATVPRDQGWAVAIGLRAIASVAVVEAASVSSHLLAPLAMATVQAAEALARQFHEQHAPTVSEPSLAALVTSVQALVDETDLHRTQASLLQIVAPVLVAVSPTLSALTGDRTSKCLGAISRPENYLGTLYKVTLPDFWVHAAHSMHQLKVHSVALAIVTYLHGEVDAGDRRCGLSAEELAEWTVVLEELLEEEEIKHGVPSTPSAATARQDKLSSKMTPRNPFATPHTAFRHSLRSGTPFSSILPSSPRLMSAASSSCVSLPSPPVISGPAPISSSPLWADTTVHAAVESPLLRRTRRTHSVRPPKRRHVPSSDEDEYPDCDDEDRSDEEAPPLAAAAVEVGRTQWSRLSAWSSVSAASSSTRSRLSQVERVERLPTTEEPDELLW